MFLSRVIAVIAFGHPAQIGAKLLGAVQRGHGDQAAAACRQTRTLPNVTKEYLAGGPDPQWRRLLADESGRDASSPACPPGPGRRILISMNQYRAVPRRPLPGSPFNRPAVAQPEPEHYAVSDQVTHDKYGLGTVIGVDEGISVLIDFGSHKQRLRTPCTKLTKL
jgi:hypothetical protein